MTPLVLTLIGDADTAPLKASHVRRVKEQLEANTKTNWLADNEACDIHLMSTAQPSDLVKQARDALSVPTFDVTCTPKVNRRKRLLISDMDSTIIDQECINELGDAVGLGAQIRTITSAVINGDMSFSEALRARLAMMKDIDAGLLENIYQERISLKPGARTLVQTMRHHGAFCILVSGGFSFFTERIAARVGFQAHRGNELVVENGKLTGDVVEPILGQTAKRDTLMNLCRENNLTSADVLAVGDGANDIKMIRAAGLGVAFHGADAVNSIADACIHVGDLTALLYIQGYRKSEFVLS